MFVWFIVEFVSWVYCTHHRNKHPCPPLANSCQLSFLKYISLLQIFQIAAYVEKMKI